MKNEHVAKLVKDITLKVHWTSWDESSRRLLAGALSPMIGMKQSQKGATPAQWGAVRLARHLFGTGSLPLPSFIIKQWISTPDLERRYWIEKGAEASPEIILNTDRQVIISRENHA